jgi:hypothetical protein
MLRALNKCYYCCHSGKIGSLSSGGMRQRCNMEKASLLILPRRKDQRRAKLVRKYLQKLLKIEG